MRNLSSRSLALSSYRTLRRLDTAKLVTGLSQLAKYRHIHSERACREQASPCPNSNVTRGLCRLTIRTATSRATEATARTIEAMRRARGGIAFGKEVALKLVNLVHGLTQNVLSGLVATERPQSERTCAGRLRNIPPFRANATTPDSRSRIFGPK